MSTRPVRVLHVIHHLQPGGMEYGLIKLVNALGPDIESVICSTTTANPAMKAMLSGKRTLDEIAERVVKKKIEPQPRSGRQEHLENVVNRYV